MDSLSAVSETALITLKARAIEARKEQPLIHDDMGLELLNRLTTHLPAETRQRVIARKLPAILTNHIALRARKYDIYARRFIEENEGNEEQPAGLVVSLGCGFDTRYWRVSEQAWNYVEIDLPNMIKAKKEALAGLANYKMIGCSVLEETWVDQIMALQTEKVLFLAEGLFMYLPQAEVIRLFQTLSSAFSNSQIVFEVVHKKYTQGVWKKMVESKMKRNLGSDAGASYQFGLQEAKDIEGYGKTIKVVEEWSYYEDDDIRPKFLRLLKNFKFMSRTQWTIKAAIG